MKSKCWGSSTTICPPVTSTASFLDKMMDKQFVDALVDASLYSETREKVRFLHFSNGTMEEPDKCHALPIRSWNLHSVFTFHWIVLAFRFVPFLKALMQVFIYLWHVAESIEWIWKSLFECLRVTSACIRKTWRATWNALFGSEKLWGITSMRRHFEQNILNNSRLMHLLCRSCPCLTVVELFPLRTQGLCDSRSITLHLLCKKTCLCSWTIHGILSSLTATARRSLSLR